MLPGSARAVQGMPVRSQGSDRISIQSVGFTRERMLYAGEWVGYLVMHRVSTGRLRLPP